MHSYQDWRDGFKSQENELTLDSLDIQGQVPRWLNGAFISTGPGNFNMQGKHATHWFDGYAMLKGFYIKEEKVSFRNRLLLSDTYLHDELISQPHKLASFNHPQKDYILNRIEELKNNEYYYDNGNVNVCQLGDSGVAMTEVPSKVTFDLNTLDTIGHLDFDSGFGSHTELAHPTFDPISKELVNVACIYGEKTEYIIYRFDEHNHSKIECARYRSDLPFYLHSFCITEHYFILLQTPLLLDLSDPDAPFEEMLVYQENTPTQFIVIDRNTRKASSYPTDPFVCFHQANAFEKENRLILDLCCYQAKEGYDSLNFSNIYTKKAEAPTYLTRYDLELESGSVTTEKMCALSCDFPRLNTRQFSGRQYQYNYLARIDVKEGKSDFINGLIKINMDNKKVKIWEKNACYCSEPIFVAKPDAQNEDEGVVLSVVFNALDNISFLLILDAQRFEPIAQANLPTFMPFGLHGDWFG